MKWENQTQNFKNISVFSSRKLLKPINNKDVSRQIRYIDVKYIDTNPNLQKKDNEIKKIKNKLVDNKITCVHQRQTVLNQETQEKYVFEGSPNFIEKNEKSTKNRLRLSTIEKEESSNDINKLNQGGKSTDLKTFRTLIKMNKSDLKEKNLILDSLKYTNINKIRNDVDKSNNSIEFSESLKKKFENFENSISVSMSDNIKSLLIEDTHKLSKKPNEIIGKKIKFKLGEIINHGSSNCYKALNQDNGSIFIVKKYNFNSENQTNIESLDKLRIFCEFDNQNIIKCYDFEILNNSLLLYLEYLPGGSMKSILQRYGTLEERIIKIYLKQIINGICYLHSKGIKNLELNLNNILLDNKGTIKINVFDNFSYLQNNKLPKIQKRNHILYDISKFVLQMIKGECNDHSEEINNIDNLLSLEQFVNYSKDFQSISNELLEFLKFCNFNTSEFFDIENLRNHHFLK